MDSIKQTYQQFIDLFRKMSPSQQGTLAVVTVVIVGAFGYLMWNGTAGSAHTPLSVGKVFTVEEIIHAEEALLQAGLTDFKRKGQRLTVPSDQVEKYNSVLIASGTMPQNWAEEWEKQFSGLGPFANNKQMAARKEIARAKLASQMISSLPDIQSANVVWDQEQTKRWPQRTRSTATVFIKPKRGKQLEPSVVHSIQLSIAGMKADLDASNVTIFDNVKGIAYQAENKNDPFGSGLLRRVQELKEMYRSEIMRSVDYIDFVRVAINVDVEKVKSAIRRQQTIETKGSVTLFNSEKKNSRNSNQSPDRTEPGQGANAGLDLKSAPGVKRSDIVENSNATQITIPSYNVTQETLIGAMPENVQVSIAIPEEYYKAVALQSGALAEDADQAAIETAVAKVRQEVNTAIQSRVAKLIPTKGAAQPADVVEVGSYVRIPTEVPEVTSGMLDTISWGLSQWGSAIALSLFALWAMWMLNRSVRKSAGAMPEISQTSTTATADKEEEKVEEKADLLMIPPPDTRNRDSLQHLVRDNPEMTASILSKWVQDAM